MSKGKPLTPEEAKKRSHLKTVKRGRIRLQPVTTPLLTKKKVTVSGMKRFVSQLLAAYAPHMVPEALETLRHAMNTGDIRAAETTLKTFEALKSGPGISVNQNNVNAATADNATHRSFESIIRNSALSQNRVIDVGLKEGPPLRMEPVNASDDIE